MNNNIQKLVAGTLVLVLFVGIVPPVFAPPPACLGNIDFDTFPDGTVPPDGTRINTQYEPCGVSLFTTNVPGGPLISSGSNQGSPPNSLVPTGRAFGLTGDIRVQFSSPVSGDVSVFGMDVRTGGLRLQAFDSAHAVVDTFDIAPSSADRFLTMTVSGNDIVNLVISQIISQTGGFVDGYLIDDLIFTPPTAFCGDGLLNVPGEQCDDLNLPTASCDISCMTIPPSCGFGTILDIILNQCVADNTALDEALATITVLEALGTQLTTELNAALAALAEAQAQRDAILTTLFEFLRVFGVI